MTQCRELADVYETGKCGAAVDLERALALRGRVCRQNRAYCRDVANSQALYQPEVDVARILELMGCAAPDSCGNIKEVAALIMRPGPAHNPTRALAIYVNRCGDPFDGDISACRAAADMYDAGDVTKKDRKRAAELRRLARKLEKDQRDDER